MLTDTPAASRSLARSGASAMLLAGGALAGLLSVYSTTRAGCALWMAIALLLTFSSGLLLRHARPGSGIPLDRAAFALLMLRRGWRRR